MRVLVTGATGLVGSHTVAALSAAGLDVRVLVRSREKAEGVLGAHDLAPDSVEYAVGDVTDVESVERATAGCRAVVHTAALFTMDRRRQRELEHTNIEGARIVLDAAVRQHLDPIVYVSSISALGPSVGGLLDEQSPVKTPTDMYARSKAEAERAARSLQDTGSPVVIVYPGGIWGPLDPTIGDGVRTLLSFIRAGVLPGTSGGFPIVDARDLARIHVAAMQPGRGSRRYMAGGHFLSLDGLAAVLTDVTGRRFRMVPSPAPLMRGIGKAVDWLEQLTGYRAGPSHEAMVTLTRAVAADNSRVRDELGIELRSPAETFADTLAWMHQSGRVSAGTVGRLAGRD